jgi:uncharacterized protein with LGFP repeats
VKGRISYKASIGPRFTTGAITTRYAALGNEGGVLGYPVQDPIAISHARASKFEHGRISWHPSLGAYETTGALAAKFAALGSELGMLKFPTASPRSTPDGVGRYSTFQLGRISWHPTVGAHGIGHAVAVRYVALGGEGGRLGYPVTDETPVSDTVRTVRFQHGRIVWTSATGAVEVYEDVDAAYARAGSENGVLGVPSGREQLVLGGRAQVFTSGRISVPEGGPAHFCRGPIAARYAELGNETGTLGFPVSDETWPSAGVRRNDFQRGSITYDESSHQTRVELR